MIAIRYKFDVGTIEKIELRLPSEVIANIDLTSKNLIIRKKVDGSVLADCPVGCVLIIGSAVCDIKVISIDEANAIWRLIEEEVKEE